MTSFFFFSSRRRHTRFDCDWSSDVCSSDLALGGQAGTSPRIENVLGFPAGLSGEEFAARAALQAQKFGVRIKLAARAVSLSWRNGRHEVGFDEIGRASCRERV